MQTNRTILSAEQLGDRIVPTASSSGVLPDPLAGQATLTSTVGPTPFPSVVTLTPEQIEQFPGQLRLA